MTDDEILKLAHRMAWKYKHSNNANHSSTYTFNDVCMIDFAKKISKESYVRGLNDCFNVMIKDKNN